MSNAIVGSIVDVLEARYGIFRGCVIKVSGDGKLYEVVDLECGVVGDYLDRVVSDYLIRDVNELDNK